jgi:hypothetical protein
MRGIDGRERGVHPRPDRRRVDREVLEAERHLVGDEGHDDLVFGILEDARHRPCQLGRARPPGVSPAHLDAPGEPSPVEVRHEPGESAQERRLAASGGAEESDGLARLELEGHVRQGRCPGTRIREREAVDAR